MVARKSPLILNWQDQKQAVDETWDLEWGDNDIEARNKADSVPFDSPLALFEYRVRSGNNFYVCNVKISRIK